MKKNSFEADNLFRNNTYYYLKNPEYLSKIVEILGDCESVLDVGCGEANIIDYLNPRTKYTGFDISKLVIERNKKKYPNQKFFVNDIEIVPEGKYDAILFQNVLFYIGKPQELIEQYITKNQPTKILIAQCLSTFPKINLKLIKGGRFYFNLVDKDLPHGTKNTINTRIINLYGNLD